MMGSPLVYTRAIEWKSTGFVNYVSDVFWGTPLVQPLEFIRTPLVDSEELTLILSIMYLVHQRSLRELLWIN
jgi:hypothetical protein